MEPLDLGVLGVTLDRSSLGILICDAGGTLVHVNVTLAQLMGYERVTDLLGRPLASMMFPDDLEAFEAATRKDPPEPDVFAFLSATEEPVSALVWPGIPVSPGAGADVRCAFVVGLSTILSLLPGPQPARDCRDALTPREQDIVVDLITGLEITEIASRRHISPHTVRNHIKSVYKKMGVHSRAHLFSLFLKRTTPADS